VAKDLCQAHQIISVVLQKLVAEGMAEQVRVQVDTDQGRILITQRPDAVGRECASFVSLGASKPATFGRLKTSQVT